VVLELPFRGKADNQRERGSQKKLSNLKGGAMKKPREESPIFEDLVTLATSPGYVHAVARICHRDNVIHIEPHETRSERAVPLWRWAQAQEVLLNRLMRLCLTTLGLALAAVLLIGVS
jgi:hypothetical protein